MDIFCSELLPPVSRSSSHHQTTFQHSSYRQHLSALLEKPARPTYAVFWCWSTLFIPAGRCGGLLGDSEVSWGSMWNHVLYWVHHEEQETTDPVTFNVKSVASRQQHTHHWNTDTHRPEVVKGANTCQNSRSSTQTPLELCQQQDTKTQLAAGFWHHTDEFIQDKMAARRSCSSVCTQVSARWQCSLLYQRRCPLEGTG